MGGGIGMGKTCKLKDVSFQCMTKFTTKKKKKKLYFVFFHIQSHHQNARSFLLSDNPNALDKWSDGKVQIIDDLGS